MAAFESAQHKLCSPVSSCRAPLSLMQNVFCDVEFGAGWWRRQVWETHHEMDSQWFYKIFTRLGAKCHQTNKKFQNFWLHKASKLRFFQSNWLLLQNINYKAIILIWSIDYWAKPVFKIEWGSLDVAMACGWSYAFPHKIKSPVSRGQSGPGAVWLEAGGTFLTSSLRGIRMQEGEGAYLIIPFRGLCGRDHMIDGAFSAMFLSII